MSANQDHERASQAEGPIGHQGSLTRSERDFLQWLGREDFSQYGECYGPTLDRMVELGFAKIHAPNVGQSGFIAKGENLMYRAVSLTDAGRSAMTAPVAEQSPLSRETA